MARRSASATGRRARARPAEASLILPRAPTLRAATLLHAYSAYIVVCAKASLYIESATRGLWWRAKEALRMHLLEQE